MRPMGADTSRMVTQLFWPSLAFVATVVAALLFRSALFAGVRRWTAAANAAATFAAAIRLPSFLWCIVLGLFVAIEVAQIPVRLADELHVVLRAAVILSVTITLAGVLASVTAAASERRALGVGVTGLARTAVRLVVLVLGLLVLLDSLGVQITPIVTALGVGGLAVALALQDTLSNLFAGVHLLADQPIRVGDYVKLSEGVEGTVVDVGWRSTRIRMLQNNVVIVPNQTVARSIITNYDFPDRRLALPIRFAVSYASDVERVETVVLDEATRAVAEVAGMLADPAPAVRFIPGFGESGLELTLVCHVASFVDQFEVQHHVRKRLLARFRAEGIEIPYPSRTLYVRGDDTPSVASRPDVDPRRRS
jgi:small-conductance mechanosensitive channel